MASIAGKNAHVAGHFDKVRPAEYLTSLPGNNTTGEQGFHQTARVAWHR